ncbi:transposase [Streptomyces sp. NPDC060064]|uniref:transposase n=1 Tax=Streptomyces sp. NPDC060064 TaxID=3347049 RepID=UPI0036778432
MAGGPGPQPEGHCRRQTLDAIRDHVDNGVKWHALPADFPTWDRVCDFFRRWLRHGLRAEFHDRLCVRVRRVEDQSAEPTAAVMTDSQSVRSASAIWARISLRPGAPGRSR